MKNALTINSETLLAAVDLGSNSFRLEIGRYHQGQIQRVDYLKETVRQGGDFDDDRNLTPLAIDRGLKCLARFGETLKGFPKQYVRAVATQTLREARNRDVFLKLAKEALGYEVEVISGVEEARLIYQGVSRLLPQSNEKRLVLDIGGRSTEFILGQHFNIFEADSLRMGSVAWSLKYFSNGELSEKNFKRAEIAAASFLEAVAPIYQSKNWALAYGASGTVGAIAEVLSHANFPHDRITKTGLNWLRKELVKASVVNMLQLKGLKEDRKYVIAGGLSVLLAIFNLLKIEELIVADGALRHGLLYDMIEKENEDATDLRDSSVKNLATRFNVNVAQAENVAKTATHFFDAIAPALSLEEDEFSDLRRMLYWAAELHEIGCAISHTASQRHGAYILANAELMGFAQSELHRLSMLILGHHGKIKKLEADFNDKSFVAQLFCLRLAAIFCHARNPPALEAISIRLEKKSVTLNISATWQMEFPQTSYLLEEEIIAWQKTIWKLIIFVSEK